MKVKVYLLEWVGNFTSSLYHHIVYHSNEFGWIEEDSLGLGIEGAHPNVGQDDNLTYLGEL